MTKVLVTARPAALLELVRQAVADQNDIELLVTTGGDIDLLVEAGEVNPDVVVVGTTGAVVPSPVMERLVDEYGCVGVVAVDVDDAKGLIYRRLPTLELVRELGPSELLTAIHRAAEGSGG